MYSGGLHLAIDADLVGLSQYSTSVAWYITNTVFVQDPGNTVFIAQTSVPSLYGKFKAPCLPYKEGTEL